jgi:hypothetical protein
MFTIELIIVRGRDHPEVVERTTSPRHFLYDVEHRAKTLLSEAKRRFHDNPPDGYQILDKDGAVVARFSRADTGRSR